jgi:hypothetical protein
MATNTASHAVDSRTRQRLAMRRLIVIDAEAARAQGLVEALRAGGATAVAACDAKADLAAAYKLDADVMLVNADQAQACRAVVVALRRHPRTRWAALLPISFAELWSSGAAGPDLVGIAEQVSALAASAVELAVRAKGKLPYSTVIEPLGPNRLLRALANTSRRLRITLSDAHLHVEIAIAEERIRGVHARVADGARELANAPALAAALAMTSGRVLVEEAPASLRSTWNASLEDALATAAALDHPIEAPAQPESFVPLDPPSHVRPASALKSSAVHSSARTPSQNPTAPVISLAAVFADEVQGEPQAADEELDAIVVIASEPPAAEESLAATVAVDTAAEAAAAADPVPAGSGDERQPTPAGGPDRKRRGWGRGWTMAAAGVVLAGALALLAYQRSFGAGVSAHAAPAAAPSVPALRAPREGTRSDSKRAAIAVAAHAPAPSTPAAPAPSAPDAPAEAAIAPAAEPTTAAEVPSGDVRADELRPSRPATPAELRRAKRLTDQARRLRRAHKYDAAAAAYLKALELVPDHQAATLGMLRLHLAAGDGAEAVRWASRFVALQPDGGSSQLLLGDAHALDGDRALAEQAWRRARELGNRTANERLQRTRRRGSR